jgi:aspartate/methionine/tyrosine aminotransferase
MLGSRKSADMMSFDAVLANLPPDRREWTGPALARRVTSVAGCPTGGVDTWVKARRASGGHVIALNACEASLGDTPEHILEAAAVACRSSRLQRYTPAAGLPELREAVAASGARQHGVDISAAQVVITSGGKQGVLDALNAVVDPGDEVLIPSPYWPVYPAMVELANGRPVSVPAAMAKGFKVTVDQLDAAVSPRTTAVVLCSPCNPTGVVYTPGELRAIGEWARDEDLWVICDEAYEHLVYDGAVASSLTALAPEVPERCIVLGGVAMAYAMTGWRVGWLIAPSRVARAIEDFQSNATSHAPNVAQAAAVAALEGGMAPVERLRTELDRRRRRLCGALDGLPGVELVEPQGALYAFPSVESYLGGVLGGRLMSTTIELCAALFERAEVATMPGEAFGRLGHLRISFAVPEEDLEEGISRLSRCLGEIAVP